MTMATQRAMSRLSAAFKERPLFQRYGEYRRMYVTDVAGILLAKLTKCLGVERKEETKR